MLHTCYVVIPVIGAEQHHEVMMSGEPKIDMLRNVVEPHLEGDRLERVRIFWNGEYLDMFVGENSALTKVRNVRATEIYRNNVLTHVPGTDAESLPAVSGPAVLFLNRRVWF